VIVEISSQIAKKISLGQFFCSAKETLKGADTYMSIGKLKKLYSDVFLHSNRISADAACTEKVARANASVHMRGADTSVSVGR